MDTGDDLRWSAILNAHDPNWRRVWSEYLRESGDWLYGEFIDCSAQLTEFGRYQSEDDYDQEYYRFTQTITDSAVELTNVKFGGLLKMKGDETFASDHLPWKRDFITPSRVIVKACVPNLKDIEPPDSVQWVELNIGSDNIGHQYSGRRYVCTNTNRDGHFGVSGIRLRRSQHVRTSEVVYEGGFPVKVMCECNNLLRDYGIELINLIRHTNEVKITFTDIIDSELVLRWHAGGILSVFGTFLGRGLITNIPDVYFAGDAIKRNNSLWLYIGYLLRTHSHLFRHYFVEHSQLGIEMRRAPNVALPSSETLQRFFGFRYDINKVPTTTFQGV